MLQVAALLGLFAARIFVTALGPGFLGRLGFPLGGTVLGLAFEMSRFHAEPVPASADP